MKTEDLIDRLTSDVRPIGRYPVERLFVMTLSIGLASSVLLTAVWLGLRPQLIDVASTLSFWLKFCFTGAVIVLAARAGCVLAKPLSGSRVSLWVVALPFLIAAAVGIQELATAPAQERMALWLGRSWAVCPTRIAVLSVPAFLALVLGFRRLAPVKLRLAGLAAGLAAGGVGATAYALTCTEDGAAFLSTWYACGILAVGAMGAMAGPRLLRW